MGQPRTALTMLVGFLIVGPVYAQQLSDNARSENLLGHFQCFKIKDELKVKGTVDTWTPQFGPFADCKLKKARWFCAPANKTSVNASSRGESITPIPTGGNNSAFYQLCYKVQCSQSGPAQQVVADQMGMRTISKLKADMVCMPAVEPCADSNRTTFVGGAGTQACQQVTSQEECETSWAASGEGLPNSCFWDGDSCKGGPDDAGPKDVSNSCVSCAEDTLTKVNSCRALDGDQFSCHIAWTIGDFGATSCFYNFATDQCRGCDVLNEGCRNECS